METGIRFKCDCDLSKIKAFSTHGAALKLCCVQPEAASGTAVSLHLLISNIKSAAYVCEVWGEGEKTFSIRTTYQFCTDIFEYKYQHTAQVCKSALHKDRDEAKDDG